MSRITRRFLAACRRAAIVARPLRTPRAAFSRRWTAGLQLAGVLLATLVIAAPLRAVVGEPAYVSFAPAEGAFALATTDATAGIVVAAEDWPGVIRVARDLQADIRRVTTRTPTLTVGAPTSASGDVVLVGTLGRAAWIDELVRAGKLDVSPIRGRWESWVRQVIEQPFPGVARALVIVGSDKRGAIYGTYDLSAQIGVSPWYWWADVTPDRHDALYVAPPRFVQGPPAVRYRGIFLNDEAPALTNWVRAKYGDAPVRDKPPVPPGIANYGREFYATIFEVLLRLRGNYLWPAMWDNAFNEDDSANAALADEYGIVMGTSHQEPMLRSQMEWDRRHKATIGHWNYAQHPALLEDFWREGIRRNRAFESIITMGLRGANDTEMAAGGPDAHRDLLEHIVARQRDILRQELTPDVARVPQLWCLYKEVQDYYEAGMRVPDDVTLLWAEDNWGNVRRLPTAAERERPGGAGVYYHFDYHGGPRSYQWLNTNPLPKIWDQMALAHQYGADRIWIVNAGHFKGYEVPVEFFIDLAWNPARWHGGNLDEFLRAWATREFGPAAAPEAAALVAGYAKFNGRRKPELLAPSTYSLVHAREAERVVADFNALAARARALAATLPAAKRDAFYQLVQFPTEASALVNELYVAAGRNALYARQGRASANDFAAETRRLFQADLDLMAYYNGEYAGGRWAHFMDQAHLGYTTWRDPPRNSLDAVPLVTHPVPAAAAPALAVEGSEDAWPQLAATTATPVLTAPRLPTFDAVNRQRYYIELFNRGAAPFTFTATPSAPWIRLSAREGRVTGDQRLWVSLDWPSVPPGAPEGSIEFRCGAVRLTVGVSAFRPATTPVAGAFVENNGVVAIEAEHAARHRPAANGRWTRIADYGHTLSGLRAEAPANQPPATPGQDAALLEYRAHVFAGGPAELTLTWSPTLNFMPDRPMRYAVAIDDAKPQIVTLVAANFRAEHHNREWEKVVADNARRSTTRHTLAAPGEHTIRIWMVDPGLVLQRVVLHRTPLPPTYLGPVESLRAP
ncbi:glycosyl hydrolase 115 family protein [Opitutus sp. ER46]|uniref:glycosyl hydrolase 115 family protein n=1 Tax=Opitutus sp. ER46 TaxID=2161864 RepID=UPI000D2F4A5F|nr:glycosyl hydrolase 115 family protein [Opitutus sp. ER46]PTX91573.1 glycosyl hydrolase [Opitutus sp. ER46]